MNLLRRANQQKRYQALDKSKQEFKLASNVRLISDRLDGIRVEKEDQIRTAQQFYESHLQNLESLPSEIPSALDNPSGRLHYGALQAMRDEQRSFNLMLRGEKPPTRPLEEDQEDDPEFEAWLKMRLEKADLEYKARRAKARETKLAEDEARQKSIAAKEEQLRAQHAAGGSSGSALPP